MSKILITRPEHEPGVRYLSRWGEEVIRFAVKRDISVVDLHREKAVKKEFEGRVSKIKPSLIFLNGHGAKDYITGHDNEILVKAGANHGLLKNCITYAVSCNSAKELGEMCADKDTAYIGYDESFVISLERKYLNKPTEDARAAQFLKPSNHIPIALIKGHTATEATDGAKKLFKDAIIKLLPSIDSDPSAREDAADLFWDMNHLVCKGSGSKKI
jgi:hypothetical protein